MTKRELEKIAALEKYRSEGGTITKCSPSNKRPEPRRYSYSVANRGRKAFTLAGELV